MTDDTLTGPPPMAKPPFDPSRFLSLVSGNEYLEVKYRLLWLRYDHPDAVVQTELVNYNTVENPDEAVFYAKVSIPGGGSATGYGSETARGFGDYLEKAETKALGRALAALGYGTQFTRDFGLVEDAAPVVREPRAKGGYENQDYGSGNYTRPTRENDFQQAPESGELATARQMGAIYGATRNLGWSREEAHAEQVKVLGVEDIGSRDEPLITKKQASAYIEHLNRLQRENGIPSMA